MAEQYVGQHLLYREGGRAVPQLNYWLRERRVNNAEVDYVISRGDRIVPIEVKAGKSGTLRSMQQFVIIKNIKLGVRFDLNPPSFQHVHHYVGTENEVEFDLLSLPFYLVGQLHRLIDQYRSGEFASPSDSSSAE
jgi:hypothetical protein